MRDWREIGFLSPLLEAAGVPREESEESEESRSLGAKKERMRPPPPRRLRLQSAWGG